MYGLCDPNVMEGKVEGMRRRGRGRKSGIGDVRELMGWAWRNAAERHKTASMASHYRRCHSRGGDRQVPGEVNEGGYRIT